MDGAAHGGVQQGRGIAAMHRADRVVVLHLRHALEDETFLRPFDGHEAHQLANRRRGKVATADAIEEFHRAERRHFRDAHGAGFQPGADFGFSRQPDLQFFFTGQIAHQGFSGITWSS
ncbi:hypothetical protein D3C72_2124100 [compost metagenome]